MSILEALILGAVQGITEFLPVSSSGHLVLLQKVFGINEPVLLFDTAVHGGTLLAVIVVLRRDILGILRHLIRPLTLYLIIATIPAVIAALLFKGKIEEAFASGAFLGFAFLGTSVLLIASESLFRGMNRPGGFPARLESAQSGRFGDEMNFLDALAIGLFQAVAIIPGLSRSGATISGALIRKLNRDFAARFSFLLSIPVILGAVVLQAKELGGAEARGAAESIDFLPLAAGTLCAAIVAFFAIKIAMKIVRERSLFGFAAYTGALGLFVLTDRFITHYFF